MHVFLKKAWIEKIYEIKFHEFKTLFIFSKRKITNVTTKQQKMKYKPNEYGKRKYDVIILMQSEKRTNEW